MTFSIAARDGDAWGVAVASKFLAVGAVVPAVRLGVGAVATQSLARVAYLDEVLSALERGRSAHEALAEAVAGDEGRDQRQVGVVGPHGADTYTGADCYDWAGGVAAGDDRTAYAIQGNILTGPEVVQAMQHTWLGSSGQPLDVRLVQVLLAGDAAGGTHGVGRAPRSSCTRPASGTTGVACSPTSVSTTTLTRPASWPASMTCPRCTSASRRTWRP